jgi:SAM-dependent methyltransferase
VPAKPSVLEAELLARNQPIAATNCGFEILRMNLFLEKLKPAVKLLTPALAACFARDHLSRRWDAKYEGRTAEETFSAIYRECRWGAGAHGDFFSGSGSRDSAVVLPYVNAVTQFLESLPQPPSVVDLGCGDFNVGKYLVPYCGPYVACDVVPALIENSKVKFAGLPVDFRCIDIAADDLPDGDVVLIRQVLQHLSNSQILKVAEKLHRYRFLVLTEHVPISPVFSANLDKPTGGGTRLPMGSGVVITEAPFRLNVKSESLICAVREQIARSQGLIRTTLYQL